MAKSNLLNSVSRCANTVVLQIKKHSPEILIVGGVVGTITSTVMACKASTKLNGIIEESKGRIKDIHMAADRDPELGKEVLEDLDKNNYTKEDAKKDLTIEYTHTVINIVKLYAPSLILGGLSIGSIFASNNILRKRNMAIAAAYATVDKGFKEYRQRVTERFGEDLDKELRMGLKTKEIEEIVIDENGEEKIEKKTVTYVDETEPSAFARYFDPSHPCWSDDVTRRMMFLRSQMDYANDKLRANRVLFLNEVYDMLGYPRVKEGQIVGWVYDKENETGDNYVDFGIYDMNDPEKRDFVNGRSESILLDFNVDGVVYDLLK